MVLSPGLVFTALLVSGIGYADYVHLEWNITWVRAAPDGFTRPMIGINHQWPCPQVDVNLGDIIVADVYNGLGNESTSIHWHGFHQNTTNMMDGAVGVTQCAIPPGQSMRYEFAANQTGAYWYHSHKGGQYPDGLRGPLIVHDPSPPFEFDDEFTLTLTDFYHEQMPTLLRSYESSSNRKGREPLPDRALINEATNTTINVAPGKTYLVNLICVGAWPGHAIVFDDHEFTVVQVDGIWVDPYPVVGKHIRLAPGQRMSVLIHTKDDTSRNYAIWDTMDINMMFVYENRPIPENFNPNVTAWLVYNDERPLPPPPEIHSLNPETDFVDDVTFVPADHEKILEPVDHQFILNTSSVNGTAFFEVNGSTYRAPQIPTLYTALDAEPHQSLDPSIYGQVNPLVSEHGKIVEIVINNHHNNLHPWHLHGHQYQVIQRSAVNGGYFSGYFQNVSSTPVRRDTIMVQNHGHVVIRFRADNPDKLSQFLFTYG